MRKAVVGLTGGIASGKSTIADVFRELGVPIVDADLLAREIVEPGTPALAEIVAAFGEGVLLPDGSLHRKKLGAIVFADAAARARLNAITHPRIAALGARRMAELEGDPSPYLIYESALIVESGQERDFAALVVVTVRPEIQLARLVSRDGSGEADARARVSSQLPLADKERVADYVIRNDGTREEARAQVEAVHRALVARFGA